MQSPKLASKEALSLDEAIRTFSRRPYWQTFQKNVIGDINTYFSNGVSYAVADYKQDPTIKLMLEDYHLFPGKYLPFESATGLRVIRKGTSKVGTITHGMTRSPETYEESLFSSMLEEPKKSNWRCWFDFGLRRVTNELYRQFTEKWHEKYKS